MRAASPLLRACRFIDPSRLRPSAPAPAWASSDLAHLLCNSRQPAHFGFTEHAFVVKIGVDTTIGMHKTLCTAIETATECGARRDRDDRLLRA
jgi:hypothetical protein